MKLSLYAALRGLSLVAFALVSTGCAVAPGEVDDETLGEEASEVRTAKCPATLDLTLERPAVFSRTPTRYRDGSPITASARTTLATRMTEARGFGAIALSMTLEEKKNGRCHYRSTTNVVDRATFRTASGSNVLDVFLGKYRTTVAATAYDTNGISFASGAQVPFLVNISPAGPDGPTSNVQIGTTAALDDT